jgi:mono/diheme cytochrome c family protein
VSTPPLAPLSPGDPVEGARLGRVLGCSGCHGPELGGTIFAEIPNVARIVAPNLTEARERYDDAGLQRLLRTGVKADGRLALAMPNKAFQRLTDRQVADVIAYLREAPRVEGTLPRTRLTPLARLGVVLGEYDVEEIRADPPESEAVLADRNHPDRGRQLAQVVCGECHGMDFQGFPADAVPPLEVVGTYSLDEFTRLMREGLTRAGGETATGFMSAVARYRFTALTDEEIAAIREYLGRN